jgi:hypothetical protein
LFFPRRARLLARQRLLLPRVQPWLLQRPPLRQALRPLLQPQRRRWQW